MSSCTVVPGKRSAHVEHSSPLMVLLAGCPGASATGMRKPDWQVTAWWRSPRAGLATLAAAALVAVTPINAAAASADASRLRRENLGRLRRAWNMDGFLSGI